MPPNILITAVPLTSLLPSVILFMKSRICGWAACLLFSMLPVSSAYLQTASTDPFSNFGMYANTGGPMLPDTAGQFPRKPRLILGAERLDLLLPALENKTAGLVINHSSLINYKHLVDTLLALNVCVARLFAPEHGFRGVGEAGEKIYNGIDPRTGLPVISLYGKIKKPRPEDLAGLDVVVFDIQDVGARFYTYITTLFYVLEACAENQIPVIILDRPNPNGHLVDGPVLDMRLSSFVGIAPLPIAHGCTVGELAKMFVGEGWIRKASDLKLEIIPCINYDHSTIYEPPVRPSPNLPNLRSVLLYPSLCLFEGTVVSVGRGTATPFQYIGHPAFPDSSFYFVPRPNEGAKSPLFQFKYCYGFDLSGIPIDSLQQQNELQLEWLLDFYWKYPDKENFFLKNGFFDLLAGTDSFRKFIEDGCTAEEIRATWKWDLEYYRNIRQRYLIYP